MLYKKLKFNKMTIILLENMILIHVIIQNIHYKTTFYEKLLHILTHTDGNTIKQIEETYNLDLFIYIIRCSLGFFLYLLKLSAI